MGGRRRDRRPREGTTPTLTEAGGLRRAPPQDRADDGGHAARRRPAGERENAAHREQQRAWTPQLEPPRRGHGRQRAGLEQAGRTPRVPSEERQPPRARREARGTRVRGREGPDRRAVRRTVEPATPPAWRRRGRTADGTARRPAPRRGTPGDTSQGPRAVRRRPRHGAPRAHAPRRRGTSPTPQARAAPHGPRPQGVRRSADRRCPHPPEQPPQGGGVGGQGTRTDAPHGRTRGRGTARCDRNGAVSRAHPDHPPTTG